MYLQLYTCCFLYLTLLTGTVQASLETVCNRTLTESSGVINVPYNSSLTDVYCELRISVSPGDFIIFSIIYMDAPVFCPSYLSMYDGNSTNNLIGSTCYIISSCSETHYSTSNSMLVTFKVGSNYTKSLIASYLSNRCPPNKYRMGCEGSCRCVQENTKRCLAKGACECIDGWTSSDCSLDIDECLSPTACPEYSTCVNLNGSYECHCFEGSEMSVTGQCVAAVECTDTNCSHACVRVTENQTDVDRCLCPLGMELNGTVCTECSNFTYGRNCENTCKCSRNGTASCDLRTGKCTCLTGWTSNYCQEDINECRVSRSPCGSTEGSYCINRLGSYDCVCFVGYEKTPQGICQLKKCEEVFTNSSGVFMTPLYPSEFYPNTFCSWEILIENGSIIELNFSSQYPLCDDNLFGRAVVKVYDGESSTSPALILDRSCRIYNYNPLPLNYTVYSTKNSMLITLNRTTDNGFNAVSTFIASYKAIGCPPFTYLLDCSASCNCVQDNTHRCDLHTGICVCSSGWTSADCSVNINECTQSPCLNYTTCTDTMGSYVCQCQDGLLMDPVTGQCKVPFNSTCSQRNCSHLCVNVQENGQDIEQCRCPVGSKLEGDTCEVCSNFTYGEFCQRNCSCVHHHTASCDMIHGNCSCLPGWTSDDCSVDIDECSPGMFLCGDNSECVNTPGSYVCKCRDYYERDTYGSCIYTGCIRTLTQTSGVIKSPNYPSNYNKNSNCQWTIIVPADYFISLNFKSLQLDCNYDYVTVYDGSSSSSSQLGRYCTLPFVTLLQSSSNSMFITFSSDTIDEYSGFMATYNVSGCPAFKYLLDCSGECSCVQENALGCNIRTGQCRCRSGYTSPTCSDDINECLYMSVCPEFSRCINLNGNFRCECFEGLQMSQTGVCIVNNSSQCTDRNCSHVCAKVMVNNITSERCYCQLGSEPIDDTCQVCSNFTYGENCLNQCDCTNDNALYCNPVNGQCMCYSGWTSNNCSVDINECSVLSCGPHSQCVNTPGSYRCKCLDNYELNANGTCIYSCNNHLNQTSGVIFSPNYPLIYDAGRNCRWLITAADNSIITLSFSALNTECLFDYVNVYDGNSSSATQLGRLCQIPLYSLQSTSNNMLITFTSDRSVHFTGFKAIFNATGCPPFTYLPPECNGTCSCVQENTRYCNISTGQCVCKAGWTAPDCSLDVNECLDLPCMNYSQCINRNGSYECNCLNGLTKSRDSEQCEVETNSTCTKRNCSHVCVKVTENRKKVEKCYCPFGSKLIGSNCKVCDKFTYGSECQNKCSCTSKTAATCDPVRGNCTCLPGWTSQNCSVDVDECSTGNATCGKNSNCVNTPGSYKCVCLENFELDSLGYCVFIGFISKLTNGSGMIKSPGFPYYYNSLLSSRWTIVVPKGFLVQLNFTALDTECGYDDVKIYDGDNERSEQLGRYCSLPNEVLVSTNNKLLIVFTSDSNTSRTGFMAIYNSTKV